MKSRKLSENILRQMKMKTQLSEVNGTQQSRPKIEMFNLFFLYFFYCSSTIISIFTAPHPPAPPSHLCPLALSMCPSYVFLDAPPIIPYYPYPLSSLVTVRLFFISMSLVVFCLLIFLVD